MRLGTPCTKEINNKWNQEITAQAKDVCWCHHLPSTPQQFPSRTSGLCSYMIFEYSIPTFNLPPALYHALYASRAFCARTFGCRSSISSTPCSVHYRGLKHPALRTFLRGNSPWTPQQANNTISPICLALIMLLSSYLAWIWLPVIMDICLSASSQMELDEYDIAIGEPHLRYTWLR